MENGEGKQYSTWSNFVFNFKRLWPDVTVLISIFLVLFLIPTDFFLSDSPKMGLLSIFIGKLMFISAGIVHAHITRKILWQYIDFSADADPLRKVMIIGWYLIIIFAWARGG
jgi:hypothetical protein